jgi:uncharacterized protein involved in outer membrane biogenesis
MSKLKKIALIVVIALVRIVVVLAIAIPMLFDVDRYRPQVAAELQGQTGKPAHIGRLALTVFPQVAIRVDDFALENPAGFPAGDFVKATKIYVVVNASALMHHQVEIISLELDDLTLNMLEDTQGKWNFENPPPKAEAAAKPSGGNNGASFTLGVISKVTVAHGQFSAASLLPSGALGPKLVDVHDAAIDLHDVNLSAFTAASLREPASAPGEFAALEGLLLPTVYAADSLGPAVAQGTFKADALQFGDLSVSKVSSKIRLYPKQVFVDDLDLKCYGGGITGNLSLNFGGANLSYGVDAKLKGINVAELLTAFPQAKGMMTGTLEGAAKMNGLVTHSSDPLAGITGAGQAAIRDGKMPSLQLGSNLRSLAKLASVGPANGDPSSFSSLSADFHIADGKLSSNKISMVGNGVDVDGSGNMSMAGEGTLDYQGDASLAAGNNPLAGVMAGLGGGKVENGKITFPFAVAGTFAKPKFSLKGTKGGAAAAPADEVRQQVNGIAGMFKKKKQ